MIKKSHKKWMHVCILFIFYTATGNHINESVQMTRGNNYRWQGDEANT